MFVDLRWNYFSDYCFNIATNASHLYSEITVTQETAQELATRLRI